MSKAVLLLALLFVHVGSFAQLKISRTEKLPLQKSKSWSNPIFSPDGKKIFYTTAEFNGIWEYTMATKLPRQVVTDARSGFNFALSSDGKAIAYRRTLNETKPGNRVQEIVRKSLVDGKVEVIASGSNLSSPVFSGAQLIYTDNITTKNLQSLSATTKPFIIGIEDTKISLIVNGKKRLLDPLKNGSYIWPQLSTDGKRIVAGDIMRGTFVSDLQGNNVVKIGKRNAAVWTRDGRWLIYMNDKDDGHNISSSDLFCVSPDGKTVRQLTATKNEIEMNPSCSPVDNKIVCNTLGGEILVLTYEEARR